MSVALLLLIGWLIVTVILIIGVASKVLSELEDEFDPVFRQQLPYELPVIFNPLSPFFIFPSPFLI